MSLELESEILIDLGNKAAKLDSDHVRLENETTESREENELYFIYWV